MGKLSPGAVEGMDDGPQNLILMASLCICRSEGQGLLISSPGWVLFSTSPHRSLDSNISFRGSPCLTTQDGSPDLVGPSKRLMILPASCEL